MPDFRLETEMTDNLELKEIIDSDEELSQALQAIEEASTDTVADDINQLRAQSSRFAQLDDDQKKHCHGNRVLPQRNNPNMVSIFSGIGVKFKQIIHSRKICTAFPHHICLSLLYL